MIFNTIGDRVRSAGRRMVAGLAAMATLLTGLAAATIGVGTANAAVSSGDTVYLDVVEGYDYGGYTSTEMYVGDYAAYCMDPSATNPGAGEYTAYSIDNLGLSSTWRNRLRRALWFSYENPGFDSSMWPDTYWNGTSWSPNKYRAISHIIIAAVTHQSWNDALYGVTDEFYDWFMEEIYNEANEDSLWYKMTRTTGEVPSSFNVFYIDPGSSGLQRILFADYNPEGYASLTKSSANTSITEGNDCYSLEGAEFTVYDSDGNNVGTLTTDADGNANTLTLEEGTYTVKETKAPTGYYLNEDTKTITVKSGETATVKFSDTPANDPVSLLVAKTSSETGLNVAQGGASLAGAEFTVEYYDTLDYDSYDALTSAGVEPTRSWVVATDEDGYAELSADYVVSGDALYTNSSGSATLPRGTVVIYESKAPVGYRINTDVSFQKIQEDVTTEGVITFNEVEAPEQVYRGDLEFTKKAGDSSERLANVPFKVTSNTTGESHVIVTDGNGYYSSETDYNPHSQNTNGNDWALDETDVIDSDELDNTAGVWFSGSTDVTVDVDDSMGALPYDTYTIEELRCTNNEGYQLTTTTVTISRDGYTVDYGTIDDPVAEIHTLAYDTTDNDNYVGVGPISITDKVTYSGLVKGQEYTISGQLYDAETGEALTDDNGNTITAETSFTAESSSGTAYVTFEFESYDLGDTTIVVYESLIDAGGSVIAEHKDADDIEQQVTSVPPEIGTTATDGVDGDQDVVTDTETTIVDTVSYTGLTVGETYTVTGTLMNQETGEALTDADGNEITASAEFTAENESGTVDVTFTFDATGLTDVDRIVVFEDLYYGEHHLAAHADLEDESQTVTLTPPEIGTTAADGADGDNTVSADTQSTVVDTVSYNNLVPGKEYTVVGTLMDKTTGEALTDSDGNEITASATFTPEDSTGTVDVTFTFDSTGLEDGSQLVAFESLQRDGVEVAVHADLEDESQTVTVTVPAIGTSASDSDGDNNDHEIDADSDVSVTDIVSYSGLVPGVEYTLKGTLMDKATGGALTVDGSTITAETTFTPESSTGSVELELGPFDATELGGHDLVVFEEVYRSDDLDTVVAEHKDLEDERQTVTVSEQDSLSQTGVTTLGVMVAAVIVLAAGLGVSLVASKRHAKANTGAPDDPDPVE